MDMTIKELLASPEDQWFERKSFKIQPKDLAKAIVAFANAEGGTIAVGITDRKPDGIPSTAIANRIRQTPIEQTDPTVQCTLEIVETVTTKGDPAQIYLFHVHPSEKVHYTTNGDCFLRVGDQSHSLGPDEILELRYSKGEQLFDAQGVPGTTLEDLNASDVEAYAYVIGSSSPTDALRARGLVRNDGTPTVAAHLLFGNDLIQRFPNAHIRVLKFAEPERLPGRHQQLETDLRFEGPLPTQLADARKAILELLPTVSRLGNEGKFVDETLIPPSAWLEGLVNAVIHRSYSIAGDHIRFEIFPDKIVISSPGRFPGLADPRTPESISRFARNPHIARVAAELRLGQELGEGIRRIFSEMRSVGFLDPVYQQTSGSVVLTLKAVHRLSDQLLRSLPAHAESALSVLQKSSTPLSTRQVADALSISVPSARRALQALRDEKIISWNGTSPRDPRATWSALHSL